MDYSVKDYWQNYVNGEWIDGGDGGRITVINPATAKPLAEVAQATPADINSAVEAARAVVKSRALASMNPIDRGRMVVRMGQLLRERKEEIARLVSIDAGKPIIKDCEAASQDRAGRVELPPLAALGEHAVERGLCRAFGGGLFTLLGEACLLFAADGSVIGPDHQRELPRTAAVPCQRNRQLRVAAGFRLKQQAAAFAQPGQPSGNGRLVDQDPAHLRRRHGL
mgnify:CR=1 FL=1